MSAPRVVWFVRVGETIWEAERRLQGQSDLPLSAAGRAMVMTDARTVARSALSAIHHPDDEAARETARTIVAALAAEGTSAKSRVATELADPSLGVFEGMSRSDLAERFPTRARQLEEDPGSLVPPEGESIVDARARIFEAIAIRVRKSRGREIAFLLHPFALALVRCALGARPLPALWSTLEGRRRVERYLVTEDAAERLLSATADGTTGTVA